MTEKCASEATPALTSGNFATKTLSAWTHWIEVRYVAADRASPATDLAVTVGGHSVSVEFEAEFQLATQISTNAPTCKPLLYVEGSRSA